MRLAFNIISREIDQYFLWAILTPAGRLPRLFDLYAGVTGEQNTLARQHISLIAAFGHAGNLPIGREVPFLLFEFGDLSHCLISCVLETMFKVIAC